jgi:hypothetical protein
MDHEIWVEKDRSHPTPPRPTRRPTRRPTQRRRPKPHHHLRCFPLTNLFRNHTPRIQTSRRKRKIYLAFKIAGLRTKLFN